MSKTDTHTAAAQPIKETNDELRGRDIVCFSHDWTGDPLSRTHLMRILARDNRILWVNSIGCRAPTLSKSDVSRIFKKLGAATRRVNQVEPNIFVLNPLAIPAYGSPLVQRLNRQLLRFQVLRAMRRLGFRRTISWITNPAAAVIAGALGEELLIYHCVDENSAFSTVASDVVASLEQKLLAKANLVIVTSEKLHQSKARFNSNTFVVRHGVEVNHFRKALASDIEIPAEISHLPRPIIGFFGLIADWVDTGLMAHVARSFPTGSLVVIGNATTDISELSQIKNVYLLGRKPYSALPEYCKGFDVAIMPFRINELTLNSNPLKVREYLSAGLEVVSTPIPEVEILGVCRIAEGREAFVSQLLAIIGSPRDRIEVSHEMDGESWEARLDEIRSLVATLPTRRVSSSGNSL